MNGSFEVQFLESIRSVNQKPSFLDIVATKFNMAILTLGFVCIAVGYALNTIPRQELLAIFGGAHLSVDRPAPAPTLEKSISAVSRTLRELLG